MKKAIQGIVLLALIWCAFASAAFAHSLKLFVTRTPDGLAGEVYYPGARPAPQARVTLVGPDGERLSEIRADDYGAFSTEMPAVPEVTVVAEDGFGHRAETHLALVAGSVNKSGESGTSGGLAPEELAAMLQPLIREEMSRQLEPLRHELHEQSHQAKWQDIIGGAGYIVGLFGLVYGYRWRQKYRMEHKKQ